MKNRIISLKPQALRVRRGWIVRTWLCGISLTLLMLACAAKLTLINQEIETLAMPEPSARQLQAKADELQEGIESKQALLEDLSSIRSGIPLELLNLVNTFEGLHLLSITAHPHQESAKHTAEPPGLTSDTGMYSVTMSGIITSNEGISLLINTLSQSPYIEDYNINSVDDTAGTGQIFDVDMTVRGKSP